MKNGLDSRSRILLTSSCWLAHARDRYDTETRGGKKRNKGQQEQKGGTSARYSSVLVLVCSALKLISTTTLPANSTARNLCGNTATATCRHGGMPDRNRSIGRIHPSTPTFIQRFYTHIYCHTSFIHCLLARGQGMWTGRLEDAGIEPSPLLVSGRPSLSPEQQRPTVRV